MTRQRTFEAVLRSKREGQEMSVRGLAEAVGVAPSSILRFESGYKRPSADTVKRLAKALHTDADELLGLASGPLPNLGPYLRARYDLTDEAIAELEEHFAAVTKQRPRKGGRRS